MLRPLLWATLAVAAAFASGDLYILHSPASVQFHGDKPLDQSVLKEVFTAALGFTSKVSNWDGIYTKDFDGLPEAIVGFAIEDMEHLESPRGMKYPLNTNEAEEITWQALSQRLHDRDNANMLVRIRVGDGVNALGQSALGALTPMSIDALPVKSLNIGNETDRKILEEIALLHAIARNVPTAITPDGKSDVFWFVVSGMPQLIDLHRKDPQPVKEALSLLNNAINDVSEAFMQAYNNNVLIAAFSTSSDDQSKSRQSRSINLPRERREEPPSTKDDSDKNVNTPESTSTTPITVGAKNDDDDEEENEKREEEEAKTRTFDEGSNLKKEDESPSSMNERNETKNEITVTEPNESRESSTVESSYELEDTLRNNENSNSGTENTNRSFKMGKRNAAKRYSDNYPVIFNIFLWFGVIFVFSLLAICIVIADMDPGRDSVIYRMTSTRMKKDN